MPGGACTTADQAEAFVDTRPQIITATADSSSPGIARWLKRCGCIGCAGRTERHHHLEWIPRSHQIRHNRGALPVTRIRLTGMDMPELLAHMTSGVFHFRTAGIRDVHPVVVERVDKQVVIE